MPLIVATNVCHAARLQGRTGSARTSLGPTNLEIIHNCLDIKSQTFLINKQRYTQNQKLRELKLTQEPGMLANILDEWIIPHSDCCNPTIVEIFRLDCKKHFGESKDLNKFYL